MKRSYSAFAEDIPPYSGPKVARDSYTDLKQLSTIPGHIYTRPGLQILPGQRRFSKVPWLVPMLELLPPSSIGHLKEWGLSTVFLLAKNYNKLVHVWESVTAMAELWHPQTNSFGIQAWRKYLRSLIVADFDMRPRFMHGRIIHLPQRTGLALRLLGNEALVSYNPDRCYFQCGAARTVVPLLSHFPPIQERKRGDVQDERVMRSAAVHWEGCAMSAIQAEVEEDDDVTKEYVEALKKLQPIFLHAQMGSVDDATVRGVAFMSWPSGVSRLCRGGLEGRDMNATARYVASRTDSFKKTNGPLLPPFRLSKSPNSQTFKTSCNPSPLALLDPLLASDRPEDEMESGKNTGEGSSRRKRQAERRSSRRRAEEPPVEGEVPEVGMEEEEQETAPVMNVEEERKKRVKAMKTGEMRARVSWTLVLAVFLAFSPFQRERVEEMGFGEILRMGRMRVDPALTQALRSRWDTEATAFAFPWGHMIPSLEDVSRITGLRVYGRPVSGYTYPCYHELAEQLLDLLVERRSSLVPRVALQESLGLYEAGKNAGESEDEYLERLSRVSRRELASEPGQQVDLDLRRFLILFLGRLLFATRGDAVHCRFLPLLEDLGEVGGVCLGSSLSSAPVRRLERLRAADIYERLLPLPLGLGLSTPPSPGERGSPTAGPRAHCTPLGLSPRHPPPC
ncbi:hypothetical protein Taro_041882 [Colocasia esculenta]|uniref:Aminotransferase-like plant mobile domain-containing protein n=1 Tax=Colocasia esculenta TaxID=4460 RepID=A0A843X1E9_COLES|nr:hypothetical protein [Colocasia esculenta]